MDGWHVSVCVCLCECVSLHNDIDWVYRLSTGTLFNFQYFPTSSWCFIHCTQRHLERLNQTISLECMHIRVSSGHTFLTHTIPFLLAFSFFFHSYSITYVQIYILKKIPPSSSSFPSFYLISSSSSIPKIYFCLNLFSIISHSYNFSPATFTILSEASTFRQAIYKP